MTLQFSFDNSFARDLDGFYVPLDAEKAPDPKLLLLNDALAKQLGLEIQGLRSVEGTAILAGNARAEGSIPLAQAYAGHQFGGFSPSLGDGRALLLGEVLDIHGNRKDIQLKGSGRTPFSRNGDGKAALGPVLREYLISEAMHALGVPTTRSLAAVTTGDTVFREKPLPGAVLTRVASSHIRVGSFQFFAARGQKDKVRKLLDYSVLRHDPDLASMAEEEKLFAFLDRIIERQARLIAQWMGLGFIHGVMNTDNMTISGETIDYGPCAFLDTYHPDTVFSSIDDFGRYAYRNQPTIGQWNLARLAESLLILVDKDDQEDAVQRATERIESFPDLYDASWIDVMRKKLGLHLAEAGDEALINGFLDLLKDGKADFTRSFRHLSDVVAGNREAFLALFEEPAKPDAWLQAWQARLERDHGTDETRISQMNRENPVYIPRNHLVEEALSAAVENEDLKPFLDLYERVTQPYERVDDRTRYENGAPKDAPPHITYCGT